MSFTSKDPGVDVAHNPTVLFVCHHNANRSPMAAGYLQHMAGNRIPVLSAGPAPSAQVNPLAVQAMHDDGVDISGAVPQLLTEEAVRRSDVIVTLGCEDACPTYPGKRYEDWKLEDSGSRDLDAVRRTRDQIKNRVQALCSELMQ